MLSGYAGKIGWIDLTAGNVSVKELDREIAKKYFVVEMSRAFLETFKKKSIFSRRSQWSAFWFLLQR